MKRHDRAIVMGVSAGGTDALRQILPVLPPEFPFPIIVVQHLHPQQDDYLAQHYDSLCALSIKEAEEKETIQPGFVYIAPANYHLLIEDDRTFSLSIDPRVNFARPSVDVLFESAADVYRALLIGVVLTGANQDGAAGLHIIQKNGGLVVVQDPATAQASAMPQAAIVATQKPHIIPLNGIGPFLVQLSRL
ncbi:MAG: chemotaxis protein CheB [Chloroflexi bacterium]|nr:chemotaxis protein CheB [Chloroflexota bacterium]MBP8056701.1 chemotaxis protein CheB [Chloroflexota bacterium]